MRNKIVLMSLAMMSLVLGALGQGAISLDNTTAAFGLRRQGWPQFYTGAAGIQVWYLNGTTYDLSAINSKTDSPFEAYQQLTTDGFTLVATFGNTAVNAGGFSLGDLQIPGVTPGGSTMTMAIAAWEGTGSIFNGSRNGVLAFYQPTEDYIANPTLAPPDLTAAQSAGGAPGGFSTTDLVLAQIPEPFSFALAGLGAAAFLIWRRRSKL